MMFIAGTFLTLDICAQRLSAEGVLDVRGTVERIRSQRAHSIQMPDQYVFCHLALLEYAVCIFTYYITYYLFSTTKTIIHLGVSRVKVPKPVIYLYL